VREEHSIAELEADYEVAWQEWEASEDSDLWTLAAGDVLTRSGRSAASLGRPARLGEAGTRGATRG
jgi:hypothetical protein